MSIPLRDEFLLDPTVIFLNHGSFGACPRAVFEVYQSWQHELEYQPVEFLGRRYDGLMDNARTVLAAYVGANPEELIFVPNATVGINLVAHSLCLQPGAEILTTDHEYGAMEFVWQFFCQQTGATLVRHAIPLPLSFSPEAIIESFWAAVTPRTRVIFMSHITSPTALILPVEEIVRRARAAGILTIIDGAHVPGQLPLNLNELGADFYAGNCHKWLCAPKGAGFLHARAEHHAALDPLIISWGWGFNTTFVGRNQWQGTRDIAAFLSVPAAIEFQQTHAWDTVRSSCHQLATSAQARLAALTGLPPVAPSSWYRQMFTAPLPDYDSYEVKTRLYNEYRIEVPNIVWNERPYLRVSIQGYNTAADIDRLLEALQAILQING
jgi:isopenicillin-N epimerase